MSKVHKYIPELRMMNSHWREQDDPGWRFSFIYIDTIHERGGASEAETKPIHHAPIFHTFNTFYY